MRQIKSLGPIGGLIFQSCHAIERGILTKDRPRLFYKLLFGSAYFSIFSKSRCRPMSTFSCRPISSRRTDPLLNRANQGLFPHSDNSRSRCASCKYRSSLSPSSVTSFNLHQSQHLCRCFGVVIPSSTGLASLTLATRQRRHDGSKQTLHQQTQITAHPPTPQLCRLLFWSAPTIPSPLIYHVSRRHTTFSRSY